MLHNSPVLRLPVLTQTDLSMADHTAARIAAHACLALLLVAGAQGCIFSSNSSSTDASSDAHSTPDANTDDATEESDGGDDEDTSDAPGPVPLSEFPGQYAEAHCSVRFRCCTEAEIVASRLTDVDFTSEATCRRQMAEIIRKDFLSVLRAAVMDDRIAYDPAKVGQTLAELGSSDCSAAANPRKLLFGTFEDAMDPNVQFGEYCKNDFDCKNEGVCESNTCVGGKEEGDECPMGYCGEGLYCDDNHEPATCGQPKTTGEPCDHGYECATGHCRDDQCKAKREGGEECDQHRQCASDICNKNGGTGVCMAETACNGEK